MSWNSGRRRCQLNNNRHAALPWLPVADLGELVRTAYIDGAGLAEDPKGPLGVMESGTRYHLLAERLPGDGWDWTIWRAGVVETLQHG